MNKLKGKKVSKKDLQHRWIEDIIYFDGPLLSLLKASTIQDYFYYWCDSNNYYNRWMAIPVTRQDILDYKSGKITTLELCNKNNELLFVDINSDLEAKKGVIVLYDDIPEEYIPPTESYYDPDLSPSGCIGQSPEMYDLQLDGSWYLDELVGIPRLYSQLYSFMYTLKNISKDSVSNNAHRIFSTYPWKGGFSTVNFFNDLSSVIPSFHEPRVNSIEYASPGQIELELLKDVASSIKHMVNTSFKNKDELQKEAKNIKSFMAQHKLSKIDGNSEDLNLNDNIRVHLENKIFTFSHLMGIDQHAKKITNLSGNELVSIKIILSIYRRNLKLFDFIERDMLIF